MIELNLRTVLPATRKAFDAGQLQAQTSHSKACFYSGPCAIGAALTPEQQLTLDNADRGTSIGALIVHGHVRVPSEQVQDFKDLQLAHDEATRGDRTLAEFEAILQSLEVKYAS